MKTKYYVKNEKGDMVLVRTSANDYRYALVDKKDINDGKKGIYCCSCNYDNVLKQYNYYKKIYSSNAESWKKPTLIERYTQEEIDKHIKGCQNAYDNLEIVELIKG